jgi:hypothetical protein
MGQASSTTNNAMKVFNEIRADVILQSQNNCTNTTTIDQIIEVKCHFSPAELQAKQNSDGCRQCLLTPGGQMNPRLCENFCTFPCTVTGVAQDAVLQFSSSCQVTAEAQQDMTTQLLNKLDQKAKESSDMLGKALANITMGKSNVSNTTEMASLVSSMLSISNVQNCYNALSTQQRISVDGGYVEGVTQRLSVEIISTVLNGTVAGQKMQSIIDNEAKQVAETENVGLFSALNSLLNNPMALMLLIAAVGVGGFIYLTSGSSGGGGDYGPPPRRRRRVSSRGRDDEYEYDD